jgi:uncharacterized phage-associated protein
MQKKIRVYDVARHILDTLGPMSGMKLQKLVYYSQAWSLVWDQRPLFNEVIAAWANGPVCPPLYHKHKGSFAVPALFIDNGEPERLDADAKATIKAVLDFYGDKSAQWLSDLTHRETPWKEARGDLSPDDKESPVITHDAMRRYYGSLRAK